MVKKRTTVVEQAISPSNLTVLTPSFIPTKSVEQPNCEMQSPGLSCATMEAAELTSPVSNNTRAVDQCQLLEADKLEL